MHPGIAAAGSSLRGRRERKKKKDRRKKKEERRKKKEERRKKKEARRKKEEARRQKAYRGVHVPANVTQKVYHISVIVTGREKRGRVKRTYKWHVR